MARISQGHVPSQLPATAGRGNLTRVSPEPALLFSRAARRIPHNTPGEFQPSYKPVASAPALLLHQHPLFPASADSGRGGTGTAVAASGLTVLVVVTNIRQLQQGQLGSPR